MARIQPNPLSKTAVRGAGVGVRAGLPLATGQRGANAGKTVGTPPKGSSGRTVPKATPGPKKK